MEATNQNVATYTVGENRDRLAQQMQKNRLFYARKKRSKHIEDKVKHAKLLKDLNDHYDKMAALHEELLINAIMRRRRRETRQAKQAEKIQPLEQKTRWLQHLANTLAKQ